MTKLLSGIGLTHGTVVPLSPFSASSMGRSHSDVRFGDDSSEEPNWLSMTRVCVRAIITLFSFLAWQLRFIEWPTFSSTFKTASLTLVLVALLIVAQATVDSGLCYLRAVFLRRKP